MSSKVSLVFSAIWLFAVTVPLQAHRFGYDLEVIKRFPHYVTITRDWSYYNCSGSIVGEKWILTALSCVRTGRFTVHFLMENFEDPRGSFSLSLDDSSVIPYPTGFDNIALIKLPIFLEYSDLLKPISYSQWDGEIDRFNNGFAVMPGFNLQRSSKLMYGMYRVLCRHACKNSLGSWYDEFLEICAVDWNKNNQVLSDGNEGSGLIQGWPKEPRLIGIFSEPIYNSWEFGLVFVRLSKYKEWIDEVIYSEYNSYGPMNRSCLEIGGGPATEPPTPSTRFPNPIPTPPYKP